MVDPLSDIAGFLGNLRNVIQAVRRVCIYRFGCNFCGLIFRIESDRICDHFINRKNIHIRFRYGFCRDLGICINAPGTLGIALTWRICAYSPLYGIVIFPCRNLRQRTDCITCRNFNCFKFLTISVSEMDGVELFSPISVPGCSDYIVRKTGRSKGDAVTFSVGLYERRIITLDVIDRQHLVVFERSRNRLVGDGNLYICRLFLLGNVILFPIVHECDVVHKNRIVDRCLCRIFRFDNSFCALGQVASDIDCCINGLFTGRTLLRFSFEEISDTVKET